MTAGGIVGALIATVRGAPNPHSLSRGCLVMAGSLSTVAVSPDVPVVLAALVGVGLAWSLLLMSTIALLQTAEDAMMGRVMSWLAVVLVGGTAVGGPLASAVGASAGPRAPFALGSAATVLTLVILKWRGRAQRDPGRRCNSSALRQGGRVLACHGDSADRLTGVETIGGLRARCAGGWRRARWPSRRHA